MDKGENFCFCFFDGKHNRCRGFTTLTASVYHPLLRNQVSLTIMEAERENTRNVEHFWTLLNETIRKVYHGAVNSFNPIKLSIAVMIAIHNL